MVTPMCPSCRKQTAFVTATSQVVGAGTVQLVCCEECGAVVGVIDYQKTDNIDSNVADSITLIKRLMQHFRVPVKP